MNSVKDKVIPTMVTSTSHDKELKLQYPIYTIYNRSYNEITRLLKQGHTVELNDKGMIVVITKDNLLSKIAPLYDIEFEVSKIKENTSQYRNLTNKDTSKNTPTNTEEETIENTTSIK